MISKYTKQNTVTRESLAKAIKRNNGVAVNQGAKIVDKLFDAIIDNIKKGNQVKLRLFGIFYSKKKNSRIGRNPKTMKEATIPARQVMKFKIAPTLKKRINSNINQISG